MSKALFVMDDMPEKRDGCILHGTIIGKQVCVAEFKRIKDENSKPDWCPLRGLPEKRKAQQAPHIPSPLHLEQGYFTGYSKGWNDCIDVITGEKER